MSDRLQKARRRVLSFTSCLTQDRRGNFGAMTALLIMVIIGLAGMAMDLVRIMEIRERFQQMADATALDAVSGSSWKPYMLPGADFSKLNGILSSKATSVFRGLLVQQGLDDYPTQVTASASLVDNQLQVQVNYTSQVPTFFLGALGFPQLELGGLAKSVPISTSYVNIHILADNSPSMGVASYGYYGRMVNLSYDPIRPDRLKGGCIYGCHVPEIWNSDHTKLVDPNTYLRGKATGIRFRIDEVKQWLTALVTLIENQRSSAEQIKMELFSLGETNESLLKSPAQLLEPLTSDTKAMRSSINSMDLMMYLPGYQGRKSDIFESHTYLPEAIQMVQQRIPDGKDGTAADKPQEMLLIITDGVINHVIPSSSCTGVKFNNKGACVETINPAICEQIKKRGVKIAVLLLGYYESANSASWWNSVQILRDSADGHDTLTPNWKKCASDNLYFRLGYYYDAHLPGQIIQALIASLSGGIRLKE